MRRFKVRQLTAPRVKNIVTLSLASIMISIPLLSLPLGLPTPWIHTGTVASADTAADPALVAKQSADQILDAAPELLAADFSDASFNRSQPEIALVNEVDRTAQVESVESRIESAMVVAEEPAEPVLEPVDYDVYIQADVLNVRAEASTDSAIVAKIVMGDRLHAIGVFGDWLQVEADDQVGFVKTEYTTTEMVFRPVDETLYVKGTSLNVRASYSTENDILANLDSGAKVHRTGIGDEWSRIVFGDGQTGYVASKFLTKSKPGSGASSDAAIDAGGDAAANASGNTIVDLAHQALGTPYVYGSESLKGMDCSGLVYWAYNKVGVSVPRSSSSFGSAGEGVSLDNAQAGDVICIDARPKDGRSTITHLLSTSGKESHPASTSQRKVSSAA
jgi:cell wall-associated NlpC family hydrolase